MKKRIQYPVVDVTKLRVGLIWHHRWNGLFCRLIRRVLSLKGDPCWGCHDGIIVESNNELYVGESVIPCARITPIYKYNNLLKKGEMQVRIYEVAGATKEQEIQAAIMWCHYILGTIYDIFALPLLVLKALFGDKSKWVAGFEWANWCTEGIGFAYRKAGRDVWRKPNATPKTTEKREVEEELVDISKSVMI